MYIQPPTGHIRTLYAAVPEKQLQGNKFERRVRGITAAPLEA